MTDLTDRLDAIQAQLDAAAPGPWRWDEGFGDAGDTGLALTNDAGAEIVGAYNYHCCSFRDDPSVDDKDAEFIAASRENTRFLLDLARKQQAALEAVRALHPRACEINGDSTDCLQSECPMLVCGPCGDSWPCPTIQALEGVDG